MRRLWFSLAPPFSATQLRLLPLLSRKCVNRSTLLDLTVLSTPSGSFQYLLSPDLNWNSLRTRAKASKYEYWNTALLSSKQNSSLACHVLRSFCAVVRSVSSTWPPFEIWVQGGGCWRRHPSPKLRIFVCSTHFKPFVSMLHKQQGCNNKPTPDSVCIKIFDPRFDASHNFFLHLKAFYLNNTCVTINLM